MGAKGTVVVSQTENTDMFVTTLGGFGGLRLKKVILLGARASYSMVEQISEPSDTSGNRRGTWIIPFSPVIGYEGKKWIFLGEAIMMGDYKLAIGNAAGQEITYKGPSGFGAEILYQWKSKFVFGVKYQSVEFSKEQLGGGDATDLTDKLTLTNIGGLIALYY